MIKSILIILFLVITCPIAFANDNVVAIVNNEAITQKDLNDFINFMRVRLSNQYSREKVEQRINQMLPDLINRLIEDRLIVQAAYKEGIIIDQNRIKARIEQTKKEYSSEADFQSELADQGLTLADIELKINEQLLMMEIIDQKIRSKIAVKPQEVTAYYYAHSQDFKAPQVRQVRFLTIKELGAIQKLQKSITEYEDLDAIAQAFSLEIKDLGWIDSEQLKEEIADIVFGLEIGEFSPILDSDDNNYIFEVRAIKPSQKRPLHEIQEQIDGFLFEQKMQEALVEWLEELRSAAYVEIKNAH